MRVRSFALATALAGALAALSIPSTAGAFALGSGAGGRLIVPGHISPTAIPDGQGGAIVASRSLADGTAIVNRYGSDGLPQWDLGLSFPDADGIQLASDGEGGAILAVQHPEQPTMTVGRILSSGAVTWQAGFPVGALVAGGDGGAWVVSQAGELFVDGITADGLLRPRIQLTVSPDSESLPAVAPDGDGGAYLAWRAAITETQFAIRLQHLRADGSLWESPAEVAGSSESSISPRLVSDGRGGALISWRAAGMLWVHNYDAGGTPAWDQVVTLGNSGGLAWEIAADDGAAFIAWTRRLRDAPLVTDLIHVSYATRHGSLLWTRSVAPVGGGVLDLRVTSLPGAFAVGWQHASLPFAGPALDPDLSVYRVDAAGAEGWAPERQPLATSLGPDSFGSLVDGGDGSVVAVFTQSPCLRAEYSGVAMQRIDAAGARAFAADGACP